MYFLSASVSKVIYFRETLSVYKCFLTSSFELLEREEEEKGGDKPSFVHIVVA